MVLHRYFIGTVGPLYYDDTGIIIDGDTQLDSGYRHNTFVTDGQCQVVEPPLIDEHVIRMADSLGGAGLFEDFTFTMTKTGLSGGGTVQLKAHRAGRTVTMHIPTITGTSNSNSFALTGLPAGILPVNDDVIPAFGADNGAFVGLGVHLLPNSPTITLQQFPNGTWVPSGTKTIFGLSISYILY